MGPMSPYEVQYLKTCSAPSCCSASFLLLVVLIASDLRISQRRVFYHFTALAVLWMTRSVGGGVGWGKLFEKGYVHDSTPALAVVISLFVTPSELATGVKGRRLKTCMTWQQASSISWGVVFLFGGGLALADAIKSSGLATVLGERLSTSGIEQLGVFAASVGICGLLTFSTEVTSNVSTATIALPIIAQLALVMKLNPLLLMVPATISTSFAFMLPIATPPNGTFRGFLFVCC